MKSIFLGLAVSLLFCSGLFADDYDAFGCKERNQQGECVKGKLTEMLSTSSPSPWWTPENDRREFPTCEQSCQNGCPNCGNCKWCWGCGMYSSDSCKGVFFYDNANSCSGRRTQSCCELCESQCNGNNTICSDGNYCQGGDPMNSTFGKCTKKVFNRTCPTCR